MNTTDTLEELHRDIETLRLNPTKLGIYDDEDMINFALRYLMSNLDHAFEEHFPPNPDAECPICEHMYGNDIEELAETDCREWVHLECLGSHIEHCSWCGIDT